LEKPPLGVKFSRTGTDPLPGLGGLPPLTALGNQVRIADGEGRVISPQRCRAKEDGIRLGHLGFKMGEIPRGAKAGGGGGAIANLAISGDRQHNSAMGTVKIFHNSAGGLNLAHGLKQGLRHPFIIKMDNAATLDSVTPPDYPCNVTRCLFPVGPMPKLPAPYSFRRLLLSRLLLLTIPALILGVGLTYFMTYRKARSALLETVRQNLTQSASRYGETIDSDIRRVQQDVAIATLIPNAPPNTPATILTQVQQRLAFAPDCLQIQSIDGDDLLASTCGAEALGQTLFPRWAKEDPHYPPEIFTAQVFTSPSTADNPLSLQLLGPIYDATGRLRYRVAVQMTLNYIPIAPLDSLAGYPVILNQEGKILMHPLRDRRDRAITEEPDAERLTSLLQNALKGQNTYIHLFSFGGDGMELIAGYTAIAAPLSADPDERWVILAIAPLAQTLTPLGHIRQTLLTFLLTLTLVLITTTMTAIVLIAREMARPVEKLRDDVLREEKLYVTERIAQNFQIAEFNQLAGAINSMIRRLISWAEELEGAWKEAQLANQLKSEFLSTVSHNLRTPLNGIIGSLQILIDGYCDTREEELEFLDKAKQSTLYLKRIIDDILDLSQLEKGKLDVEMDRVPLMEVLEEAIAFQAPALESKNLTLRLQPWPEPVVVHADRDKLRQVFLSILDNAIKFTPKGEILVTTTLTFHQPDLPLANGSLVTQDLRSPSGQLVIITIQDPGVGVAPEQQAKLFRPFVLVHAASGAGLGLAIARNLMDLMGGAIELASEGVNQGTTVTLYLASAQRSREAIGG